jgi:hypothetical protein
MNRGTRYNKRGFSDSRYGDSCSTWGSLGSVFRVGMTRPEKGTRNRRIRASVLKLSRERVLEILRDKVIEQSAVERETCSDYITVEGIATQFRFALAKVHWAFMALNREGWLTQGENHAPHDTGRDNGGIDSAWRATQYGLRKQKVKLVEACRKKPDPVKPYAAGKSCFVFDEEVPPKKKRYSKRLGRRI